MQATIDIQNCQECPYSWPGDTKVPHESVVCDKLQDNIGAGDTVFERCPLGEGVGGNEELIRNELVTQRKYSRKLELKLEKEGYKSYLEEIHGR